jgi:hypothetical protein
MDVTITVLPRRWVAALFGIVVLLGAASLCASLLSVVAAEDPLLRQVQNSFIRLTWVDGEANIPAWFSSTLLLLCSALLAVIGSAQRHRPGRVFPWLFLAVVFAFLSLDEVAQLHELAIRPLRERLETTGYLYYPWILPAGLGVSTLAAGYSGFLIALPGRTRWLFVLAGGLYIGGALGVEAISGRQAWLHGEQSLAYHLIVTLEELLEMSGLVVFVYALLDYLERRFSRLTLQRRPA